MPLELTKENRAEFGALAKECCININDAEEIYTTGMKAGMPRAVEFLIERGFIGTQYADDALNAIRALL